MRVRVLVELVDDQGERVGRKMRVIKVPPNRLKLIESFQGENAVNFILEEALTGAVGVFLAPTQNPAEVSGLDPASAPKNKLNEMLGLDIIEKLDRKDGVGGSRPMPMVSQQGQMAMRPPQMAMRPPPTTMGTRPGVIPTPGGRGFGAR